MKVVNWLVKLPYPGYTQSSTYMENGVEVVAFSKLTLKEYLVENPEMSVVSDEKLSEFIKEREADMITLPEKITKERFWDMLEILPPCKWKTVRCVEMFHISERITGNLVDWFVQTCDDYYSFTDRDSLSVDDLIKKIEVART